MALLAHNARLRQAALVTLVVALVMLPVRSGGSESPLQVLSTRTPAPRDGDLRRLVDEWIQRGDVEVDQRGDVRAGIRAFEEALTLARQVNDLSVLSRALWKLAGARAIDLNNRTALALAQEALAAARAVGDRPNEAWALDQIGNAHFGLGAYERALESFQAALAIMREVHDRFGEAVALKDVAITNKFLGRFDETLEYLHQTLNIFRELSAEAYVIGTLQNLGTAYADVGAYGPSIDAYAQAVAMAEGHANVELRVQNLTRLGFLYLDVNDPQRAVEYFRQGLAIDEIRPSPSTWLLRGLGGALHRVGDVDAAIETTRRALGVSRRQKDPLGEAQALWGLGLCYLDRDPTAAIRFVRQALAIFVERRAPFPWPVYRTLAQAYRRLGDLDRAIDAYYAAIEVLERFRGQITSAEYSSTFFSKHQPVYQELTEALLERSRRDRGGRDAARAFESLERGRARAMVQAMVDARFEVSADAQPELRGREKELNDRLARLHHALIENELPPQERQRITAELQQAEQEFDRLLVELKRRSPGYVARRYPQPLTLDRAQALLDERTALLAYSFGGDHILAFVVTARGFHAVPLAVSPQLVAARVQTYVDLVADGRDTGWQRISRRLYAELFAPLHTYLPGDIERLIIVPEGILHYLPFETLIHDRPRQRPVSAGARLDQDRPASAVRYLLEDYSISYIPSATLLAELQALRPSPASAARRDLYVVADPSLALARGDETERHRIAMRTRTLYDDEGLPVTPIPYSLSEAHAIAQYAGEDSLVHLGGDASERRIKTDPIDRYRVIHFATHALMSERVPARSALVLASSDGEDGFLQAREVYRLKLTSDLVVLSACRTAAGRILVGEGVQGMVQAFLYAGARSIVVSLWNVNDERTATFMAAFYRYLAEGRSKADALRSAKLDLIREAATAAPRYWAPFVLIGEPHESIPLSGTPRRAGRTTVLAAAAFSLLALGTLIAARVRIHRTSGRIR